MGALSDRPRDAPTDEEGADEYDQEDRGTRDLDGPTLRCQGGALRRPRVLSLFLQRRHDLVDQLRRLAVLALDEPISRLGIHSIALVKQLQGGSILCPYPLVRRGEIVQQRP